MKEYKEPKIAIYQLLVTQEMAALNVSGNGDDPGDSWDNLQ